MRTLYKPEDFVLIVALTLMQREYFVSWAVKGRGKLVRSVGIMTTVLEVYTEAHGKMPVSMPDQLYEMHRTLKSFV